MVSLSWAVLVAGIVCCTVGALWRARTRRERRLWTVSNHDARRVAMVLELEERVRQLDRSPGG